jgi:hypothetical protein
MRKIAWVLGVLLLLCAMPAHAAMDSSRLTLEQALLQRGFPPDVVAGLSGPNKEALAAAEATYRSHTADNSLLVEKEKGGELDPDRLANFQHLVVVGQLPARASGRTDLLVTYDWVWDYQPVFTLRDKFGLAWSGEFELLTEYTEAARYGYTAFGRDVETGRQYDTRSFQWSGLDQYAPQNGIGWTYDILGTFWSSRGGRYRQYEVYRHQGWAQIRVGQFANGQQQQSAVAGRYFHQEFRVGGASFTFNSVSRPTVGLTADWGYDESPTAVTSFYWPF